MRKKRFLCAVGLVTLAGFACVAPPARDEPVQPVPEASEPDAPVAVAPSPKSSLFDAHVRRATAFLRDGDPGSAVLALDEALAIEPDNRDVLLLRAHAAMLEAWRNQTRRDPSSELRVHENRTEHTPAGSSGKEEERPLALRASQDAPGPAELIVQILPLTVKPGDPYVLRVRLFNEQNRSLGVKSLEVVSTFGAKSMGKGQALAPLARVVHPRDVTVLWETRGTWSEDMSHGSIDVMVTLVDGATLTKKISW